MKLLRRIANLGYGSRKEVTAMFREGRITHANGEVLYADDALDVHARHEEVRIDGEPLDPPPGLLLMLHKPVGYTCSTKDQGGVVYDLLPARFKLRDPVLSTVGRLDRDTSGLLLMTDDGVLLHRITSPKSALDKVYEATLARPLRGDEEKVFASGHLMLESETTPLLPAELQVLEPQRAKLTLHEGRYHQVRRMFAAVGNHVETLHRVSVGALTLGELAPGQWRVLGEPERLRLGGCDLPYARQDSLSYPNAAKSRA
jgi:16S rRNA pseudouridine516 synthase